MLNTTFFGIWIEVLWYLNVGLKHETVLFLVDKADLNTCNSSSKLLVVVENVLEIEVFKVVVMIGVFSCLMSADSCEEHSLHVG